MWGAVLLLAAVVMTTVTPPASAADFKGKVIQLPGDEVLVVREENKTTHRVRLAWIDIPEARQRYYPEAQRALRQLVLGKTVTVEWDRTEPGCVEKSKRTLKCLKLGRVMQGGTDMNLELLRRGLAWHDPATVDEQSTTDRELYPYEESEARKKKLGLWKDPRAQAPWDFRQRGPASKKKLKARQPASTPKKKKKHRH